jgi:xanthine dehydrogenase large subunit
VQRVLVTASDTSKVPNASATAASSGTDLNGRAAQFAARHVRDNLAAFVAGWTAAAPARSALPAGR